MRRLHLSALAAAVMLVGVAWLPAFAATAAVDVVDNGYRPGDITVRVGDTVSWRWVGQNPHSVTSPTGGFDSHSGCTATTPDLCSKSGQQAFTWTPSQAGEFTYFCRFHGVEAMSGRVVVVAAAPSASDEPTTTDPPPGSDPSPEPTPDPEPTSSPPAESPPPPRPTASPSPSPTPTRSQPAPDVPPPVTFSETELEPEVAPPGSDEPSFDAFPDPVEPTGSVTEDPLEDDEVTVAAPGGGLGTAGLVWRILGAVVVTGTAITFGRVVLFGPDWGA